MHEADRKKVKKTTTKNNILIVKPKCACHTLVMHVNTWFAYVSGPKRLSIEIRMLYQSYDSDEAPSADFG